MFKKFLSGLVKGLRKQLEEDDQMDTLSFLSHMNSLRTRYLSGLIDMDDDISAVDYYLHVLRLEIRVAHRFRRLRKDYELSRELPESDIDATADFLAERSTLDAKDLF